MAEIKLLASNLGHLQNDSATVVATGVAVGLMGLMGIGRVIESVVVGHDFLWIFSRLHIEV
jgi:hypothetical protein